MGRPNKRLQILGIVGVLGLVVAVCLLVPGSGEDEDRPTLPTKPDPSKAKSAEQKTSPTSAMKLPVELKDGVGRLGEASSPVKLEIFFPGHSGCGSETADFAHRVYQANKGEMQVVFVDFESPGGSKYQGEAGLHCSGVAVNGKQKFKVKDAAGDETEVTLEGNYGDYWDEGRFLLALDAVFQEAYGKPANHKLPAAKPAGASQGKGGPPGASQKMPPTGGKP